MAEQRDRDHLRVKIFDGKQVSWDVWSTNTLAVMQRKDLREVVSNLNTNLDIPADAGELTDLELIAQVPLNVDAQHRMKLREQNARAY